MVRGGGLVVWGRVFLGEECILFIVVYRFCRRGRKLWSWILVVLLRRVL